MVFSLPHGIIERSSIGNVGNETRNRPADRRARVTQTPAPTPVPNPIQPIYNEENSIGYTLEGDQLQITYNKGTDWITVPVEKGKLFAGEYNGNEQELIEKSYILTQNRAAFLHSDGGSMKLIYTLDQGESWENIHYKSSVSVHPLSKVRVFK